MAQDTFQSDNSSVTTATLRHGAGGDIAITTGQVRLSYGAAILVNCSEKSGAGRIPSMDADRFLCVNNTVKTAAERADGGINVATARSRLVGWRPARHPRRAGGVGGEPHWQ